MTPQLPTPPSEVPASGSPRAGLSSAQVIASLLFSAAGLLTIVAPFLSLFVGELRTRMSHGLISVSGWTTESITNAGRVGRSHDISSAPVGYPLLFAGALLAAAAVVGLRTSRSRGSVLKLLPAVAVTFLVATVVSVGMQGIGWSGQLAPVGIGTRPGAGFWLLIASCVISSAAVALSVERTPLTPSSPSSAPFAP
jgi:hypothetical protein